MHGQELPKFADKIIETKLVGKLKEKENDSNEESKIKIKTQIKGNENVNENVNPVKVEQKEIKEIEHIDIKDDLIRKDNNVNRDNFPTLIEISNKPFKMIQVGKIYNKSSGKQPLYSSFSKDFIFTDPLDSELYK